MYYAVAATAFSLEANGCGSDLSPRCAVVLGASLHLVHFYQL